MKKTQEALDDSKRQRKQRNEDLRDVESEQHDLERRLSEVKKILGTFESEVDEVISKARGSAKKAHSLYQASIVCSGIASANVESAYSSKSVNVDSNSSAAYQSCIQEKTRLETAIERLKIERQKLKNEIDSIERQMSAYSKLLRG